MTARSAEWTNLQLKQELGKQEITQIELSRVLGASQSQISRVLSGHTSMSSKLARDICSYASSRMRRMARDRIAANDDLMDALATAWDGTPAHARAIASVIRSLALLSSGERTGT